MKLEARIEKLEATNPAKLQPGRRITGDTQTDLDRQLAEIRATGFAGLVICRLIVSPGEARHAN